MNIVHASTIKKPTSLYVEFLKIRKFLARENKKQKLFYLERNIDDCTNVECFKNTDIFAGRFFFEVQIYTAQAGLKLPV